MMGVMDFTNNGIGSGCVGNPPNNLTNIPINDAVDMSIFINYNQEFKGSSILYRDNIVQQVCAVLISKKKANAILIGQAGTGKTQIVEYLASLIESKSDLIPKKLHNKTIYELPLSSLVAGTGIVGQLEEKLKNIITFLEEPSNNAILFLDEAHMLFDDHGSSYEKIAQILKPAMARGKIKMILATTNNEYSKIIKDPAFARRLTSCIVEELTIAQSLEVLRNCKSQYEQHHNITIPDTVLSTISDIAENTCFMGSHRPDTVLTLLDRSCSYAVIDRQKKELALKSDPILYNALITAPFVLTQNHIEKTSKELVMGQTEKSSIKKPDLDDALTEIKGQTSIMEKISKGIYYFLNPIFPLNPDEKAPYSILATGSTGTGKTKTAEVLAKALYNENPIILNMTEYSEEYSVSKIIGSPAGYVGYNDVTNMPFSKLETNPYQVILLDEFEKASKPVQRLFMRVFEKGKLETNKGITLDFSKCIIIATTNALTDQNKLKVMGFNTSELKETKQNISQLNHHFDMELINRFSLVVKYNAITEKAYAEILQTIYTDYIARLHTKRLGTNLPVDLPQDDLKMLISSNYIKELGARNASQAVKEYIEEKII